MLAGLSRPLAPLAGLALGTLGLTAFAATTAQAPALREDLQVAGADGSVRVADLPTMYDHAQYLHRVGYGYLTADFFLFEEFDTPDGQAPPELGIARLTQARDLLGESLQLDPANAHAWRDYTLSLLSVETVNPVMAGDALERFYQLAPTVPDLARSRLRIISDLREMSNDPTAYADIQNADEQLVQSAQPDVPELF